MHVQPIITGLRATLTHQIALTASDPAVQAAIAQLVEALGPALRLAATEIAEQAAAEVRAQLPEHTVDVVLLDGDPSLRVAEATDAGRRSPGDAPTQEELDARITLRLTPTLKQLVEEAAQVAGESVNAWVVEALGSRTKRTTKRGNRITTSFDL